MQINDMFVFAHRGMSSDFPENTILSYQAARNSGARFIELDVQLTLCGKLVCIHDRTLDRTTNGSGLVSDYTYEQLKALDAGYRFTDSEGEYLHRGKGISIPLLEDVLTTFSDVFFSIELKDSSPGAREALVELIRKLNAFDRVMLNLIGLKSSAARKLRKMDRRLRTGHTVSEFVQFYLLTLLGLGRLFKPRGIAFEIPVQKYGVTLVKPELIDTLRAKNVALIVWTINDLDTALALEKLGVSAIMSDSSELINRFST